MRKLFIALLTIVMLLISGIAYCKDVSETVDVTVEVSSVFELTVTPDSIDFGIMAPGETKTTGPVEIDAKSNCGNPIELMIKGDDFVGGTNEIEIDNVTAYNKLLAGHGSLVPDLELDTHYETFYKDHDAPMHTTISQLYELTIPEEALVGVYKSIFTITMTE